MRFCSLSSCSYANSVVIQDRHTCILIDCGLRKRDINPFLERVGLSVGDIDAVVVTHCHIDHVYGLRFLLKAREIPLYSTAGVINELVERYPFREPPSFKVLCENREDRIGSLAVTPLRLSHDVETIGFVIDGDGQRMGFMTDTGFVPEHCQQMFQSLDYLYIESNHDVEMYRRSIKPPYVISRNLGPTGHLSNEQCGQALQQMGLGNCRLVVLGHLSEDDNEPQKAVSCARQYLDPKVSLVSAPPRTPGLWSDILEAR